MNGASPCSCHDAVYSQIRPTKRRNGKGGGKTKPHSLISACLFFDETKEEKKIGYTTGKIRSEVASSITSLSIGRVRSDGIISIFIALLLRLFVSALLWLNAQILLSTKLAKQSVSIDMILSPSAFVFRSRSRKCSWLLSQPRPKSLADLCC